MTTCTGPDLCRKIREYGCVKCQKYHRRGIDDLYEPHLFFQSKHGWSERKPSANEVLERIAKESA